MTRAAAGVARVVARIDPRVDARVVAHVAIALIGVALIGPSQAEETEPTVLRPLWELGLGLGALRLPHYRGSDQYHTWVLPVPYFAYHGKIFKADREGTRAVLFESDRVDFDLSVAASPPTRSSDDDARRGMNDLRSTFEIGPNLNWTLGSGRFGNGSGWKLQVRAPLRAVITLESHPHAIGWVASPTLNLDVASLYGWNLGLLAGPEFASSKYHAYYYDVAASEAIVGRPAYSAPGGGAGAKLLAALSRRDGNRFIGLFVRYDTLQGARFVDSPLVRQRDQLSMGIAVSWVFATSRTQVGVDE